MTDGSAKCKNDAYCYPCLIDNDKNSVMNACNEEEWNRGFKCICPIGFAPPFCDRKLGPCDAHKCMNNGRCIASVNDTLDYRFLINSVLYLFSCNCSKGFSGKFCEVPEGACSRSGHICKNGRCKDDVHYQRGFSCECDENFTGINCDSQKETTFLDWYNVSLCRILKFVFRKIMHGAIRLLYLFSCR